MKKTIFLLRHGETLLNGRYVGSTDVALSDNGRAMIAETAASFQGKNIEQIFCSPLERCRETCRLLQLSADVRIVGDLREIDFGRWEGMTFEEILGKDAHLVDEWSRAGDSFCFPEGECIRDFGHRIDRFSRQIIETEQNRILIIAHGGTLRHLLCTFLGINPEKKMIFSLQPGGFSEIELHDSGGVLTRLLNP
ncbi:histidine phosphatase family protein [Desulfomarina sp.]